MPRFLGVPPTVRAVDPERDPQGVHGRQEGVRENAGVSRTRTRTLQVRNSKNG